MTMPVFRRAVVLAAGRGSRMGPATADVPKCLHPLAGRPILAWTIDALRANGVTEILGVGGWQHESLRPWVDALRVNTRWAQTNMVRSLQAAGEWLAEAPTLVVYGDGAYGSAAVAQALAASAHDLVVPIDLQWQALWNRRFTRPLDDAEALSFEGDRLTGIGQRPTSIGQVQAQFMGLLRMTPVGWRRVGAWLDLYERTHGASAVDRLDTTSMLSGLIAGGEPVYCTNVDGGWVEIDSVTDCAVAEAGLSDPKFCHDFRT